MSDVIVKVSTTEKRTLPVNAKVSTQPFIPSGGKEGEVLSKRSNKDFDVEWREAGQGGGSGGVDEEAVKNLIKQETTNLQPKVDESLPTESKEIVGAIKELYEREDKEGVSEEQVKEIVAETYLVGDTAPTTETVAQFVGQLYVDTTGNGTYQCTAITEENGVKSYTWVKLIRSTDTATSTTAGVVMPGAGGGTAVYDGYLHVIFANQDAISKKLSATSAIAPNQIDHAVKVGLTKNNITLTDEEQTSACEWLGAVKQTTAKYKLYGTNYEGKHVLIGYTNAQSGSSIVQRNPDASIQVPNTTGQSHAVNNERMISYVGNLPDNLTLTEEQKAKWKAWLENILS